jgi:hypothetical protein
MSQDALQKSAEDYAGMIPKNIMPSAPAGPVEVHDLVHRERIGETVDLEDGQKYLRRIVDRYGNEATVDVYDVLHAFGVNDQAVGHAIKKLLCAGQRGKANRRDDLRGAVAAIQRAITIDEREEARG